MYDSLHWTRVGGGVGVWRMVKRVEEDSDMDQHICPQVRSRLFLSAPYHSFSLSELCPYGIGRVVLICASDKRTTEGGRGSVTGGAADDSRRLIDVLECGADARLSRSRIRAE